MPVHQQHPQPRMHGLKAYEFVTTGPPKQSGIPCTMVDRLIARSPRRPGFGCLRRAKAFAFRLDPSIGGTGPHAFAVRLRSRSSADHKASIASRSQRP
jgi:hypothetical protein